MVGVLMREGLLVRSPNPLVEVLHLGVLDRKRDATDLLPFLSSFRPLFSPIPTDGDQIAARVIQLPLEDIEVVTQTLVKFDGPQFYLKIPSGETYVLCK